MNLHDEAEAQKSKSICQANTGDIIFHEATETFHINL